MANELSFDVSVGNPGEDDHNTVVLGGTDLVLPLEMDLDDDPLQDDEVRLISEDGFFERHVRASDPEAEPDVDNRLLNYHFRAVPPGAYKVQVNVGGRWVDVLHGLVVDREGVAHAGARLGTEPPSLKLGPGGPTHEPEPEPEPPSEIGEYMDVNDGYADV